MIKIEDLSPRDVSSWLRAKARSYVAMADRLDADFNSESSSASPDKPNGSHRNVAQEKTASTPPTAEAIRDLVQERGFRVANLAEHFGTTNDAIIRIISTPGSGLRVALRGWVKTDERPITVEDL